MAARVAHNHKVAGSSPAPATKTLKIRMTRLTKIETRIERNEEETSLYDYSMTIG